MIYDQYKFPKISKITMKKIFGNQVNKWLVIFFSGLLSLYYPHQLLAVLAENPAKNAVANKNKLIINKKEFGVRIIDSQGKANFFPTNTVPLKEGDAYGWRIRIDNPQGKIGKVKWREVLRLPNHPEMWKTENSDKFSVSQDGKTATSTKTEIPVNGVIQNFWTITPGDPLGKYQMEIYINDKLVQIFRFEIVPF